MEQKSPCQDLQQAHANKKATANTATAEDEQLAITDGQQPPTHVSIPVEDYQKYLESLNNKVNDDKNNRANTLSVIGEELLRHVTGPASYKQSIVRDFLEEHSTENQKINEIIDTFKESIRQ